jgi:hypothetical protein
MCGFRATQEHPAQPHTTLRRLPTRCKQIVTDVSGKNQCVWWRRRGADSLKVEKKWWVIVQCCAGGGLPRHLQTSINISAGLSMESAQARRGGPATKQTWVSTLSIRALACAWGGGWAHLDWGEDSLSWPTILFRTTGSGQGLCIPALKGTLRARQCWYHTGRRATRIACLACGAR